MRPVYRLILDVVRTPGLAAGLLGSVGTGPAARVACYSDALPTADRPARPGMTGPVRDTETWEADSFVVVESVFYSLE